MKRFGFGLYGQALKAAGVGAALMLSVTTSYAQAGGPFAGFDGSWSGAGTVTLSNGANEHIRCKADYKVNTTGLGLKQNLHCASDSYKFDLSSDVTSQGDRISGTGAKRAAIFSAICRVPQATARSRCSSRLRDSPPV